MYVEGESEEQLATTGHQASGICGRTAVCVDNGKISGSTLPLILESACENRRENYTDCGSAIQSLYFGTYFTANSIDTVSSTVHSTPLETTTSGTAKFVATSSANLALCLYKDSRFTQLFGSSTSAARPVPLPTFALFTVRDCLTIFASFNLPPLLAPHLDQHLSDGVRKYASAASVAQFVTPAAVQIFSTPLHLLGLDLYNRPNGAARVPVWGADGRVQKVVQDWGMSSIARMCRIVPAFGIGGVVNAKVRKGLMAKVE